ncbi:MAG: GFA family protein [Gaiellaceae bacterium]
MSSETYRGTCFCKAVEIQASGTPAVMVFCHCESCRTWLSAPVHGATLWPTASVKVLRGELGTYKKTEASHRHFCTRCGGRVMVTHPAIGMTDVFSVVLPDVAFQPTMHVHYGEKVLAMRDGLPKFKDFPKEFGGSGDMVPE